MAVKLPRSARQCSPSANLNHNPLESTSRPKEKDPNRQKQANLSAKPPGSDRPGLANINFTYITLYDRKVEEWCGSAQ